MQSKLSNLTVMVNVIRQNAETDPQRALIGLRGLVDTALDLLNELERAVILRRQNRIDVTGYKEAIAKFSQQVQPHAKWPFPRNADAPPNASTPEWIDAIAKQAAADPKIPIWWAMRNAAGEILVGQRTGNGLVLDILATDNQLLDFGWIKIRAQTADDAKRIAESVL